ncbi:MAG: alpha/beta fold hydrolase [Pseudomonadota bacterium]
MRITRRFIDGPFGQVHLREAGEPSDKLPLLCLHQSPKSSREFVKILPFLAQDRQVVAVDNPGHGESDLPPSEDAATIEAYAASAWAAVDALGLGRVDLLGHHTGAKVATEMAWQRPDDVGAIVMVSALVLTPEEVAAFKDQFQEIPLDEAGTRFSTMWEKSIEHRGPGVSLEDLAASFAENLRAGEAYEWGHKAAFAYNAHFPDRVASLEYPIVVLNPKDMLYDLTPRVASLLKNGRIEDHPEWGFGFMDADSENAANAIRVALS